MKLKQISYLKLLSISLFISIGFSFFANNSAYAYTCDYSGPNSNGSAPGGQKLQYQNGSCVFMKPDVVDNSKRTPILNADGSFSGNYSCTGGTILHDDKNCWTYRPEYTTYKPTYDDGGQVPVETWQAICGKMSYYGVGEHYRDDIHACEAGNNCSNYDADSSGGACRKIGDTTANPDDINKDPTGAKVGECKAAGATWNGQTRQCNWTQQTCSAKNGGQGVWIDNQCKAYSDYTNENDCKKAGGAWQQDPNDATHFECDKPGTPVNSNGSGTADGAHGDTSTKTGRCGEARVNILACGEQGGATAISNVLRIIIMVLTVLVGVAALGGLAWASVTYARATDNASTVSEARVMIRNIVIGLLLYGFLIAIVNWLVPGSVIGG